MVWKVIGALVVATLAVTPVLGQSASSKSQSRLFKNQTKVLDGRAKEQYRNSVRLKPRPIYTPSKWGDGTYQGKYDGPFLDMARQAALLHGVPVDLFFGRLFLPSPRFDPGSSNPGAEIPMLYCHLPFGRLL